jgi:hypothetical protein
MPDWTDRAARRMYEGAGLGPKDVDIFNPYDGYAPMAQFFLEASSGTASNAAMPSHSTPAISGSRDRTRSLRAAQFGERAHPHRHVHRQHRAAPRHGRRPAGQGSGRDRAGGIHHAKQWRLDHVRQIPELTACDAGNHRLAAITLRANPKMTGERGLSSATQFVNGPSPERRGNDEDAPVRVIRPAVIEPRNTLIESEYQRWSVQSR